MVRERQHTQVKIVCTINGSISITREVHDWLNEEPIRIHHPILAHTLISMNPCRDIRPAEILTTGTNRRGPPTLHDAPISADSLRISGQSKPHPFVLLSETMGGSERTKNSILEPLIKVIHTFGTRSLCNGKKGEEIGRVKREPTGP